VKLQELLIDELQDIYSAETQLVNALPKMAKGSSSSALKDLIETHLEETRGQVERLKKIFDNLREKPAGEPCKGMQGIIAEGSEQLEKQGDETGDLAIIGACVRVEHYEMAAYANAITLARALGHQDAAGRLDETLTEEKEAAKKLMAAAKPLIEQAQKSGAGEEAQGAKRAHSAKAGSH
jgi:ferritin-like metal-binding protein YciE